MAQIKEGYIQFSNFDCLKYSFEFATKRQGSIKTIQLRMGGMANTDPQYSVRNVNQYNWKIRKYFYNKSKDGYYKPRFIFIEDTPQSFFRNGKGLLFNEFFFYLEEEYDKRFVLDYFLTLLPEVDTFHKNYKDIKFSKYNPIRYKK